MHLLPFALLLFTVFGLWMPRAVWVCALLASVLAGYFTGALQGLAALWIALLGALAWAHVHAGKYRLVTGLAFFLLALAMGLVLLPGFPRTVLVADTVLSPGAIPYGIGLGFPKVVGGIFILGLINTARVRSGRELARVLRRALPVLLVTVSVVMALTLALGYVRFDAKWTPLFFTWAVVNLFFTCLSEEAFFRGFVQHELAQIGSNRRAAAVIAIALASVLFGAAHLGGGWKYALAAAVAGVGYGIAYHRTQRIEASMAVHFGLNALHFLFFTYPALA
ncbi:MAG TPA: type II CAAX endopeptidase family protein [Steroidobacteraceae bacterium]|jgi:membrane protease YdiL (CAAX protease family)|nr:type II CAAX endopeptidase family protein [Steroidobacteraceae bacterium]